MVNYFLWKLEVTDCDFKIPFLTRSQIVTLNNKVQTIKNRDVGSNATSSLPTEITSTLTPQLPNDRYASGELEEWLCLLRQGYVG
jgi:hypothetical protein